MRSFTVAVFIALLACGVLAATPMITFSLTTSSPMLDYTYVAPYSGGPDGSGLWVEGTETVASNPYDLHRLWTSFTTTENGGNMLIVNGAVTPGKVFWSQAASLSAGDYVFSFMGASSYPDSLAILQLFVNERAVGDSMKMPDTPGNWQTFTQTFSASAGVNKFSLIDTNTASGGNDFALTSAAIATPEPTTFLLTGSALLGLAGLIRKFRGKV